MLTEAVIRFAIGGVIVSAFAVIGEVFRPKTFSGLFGAAPSVGIATLTLTFHQDGSAVVSHEARWMMIASLALVAYCAICARLCRHREIPVWAGAVAAWLGWFAVAAALWLALRDVVAT
jgi:hypothetical protein